MKKLCVSLLLLWFLFSCSALASDDESLYVGTWINCYYDENGDLGFILFDLQPDHTAISVFGTAELEDEELSGRSLKATWSETSKGVHIVSGHNTSKDVFLTDNGYLAEDFFGSYIVYSRIPNYDTNDASLGPVSLSMLETGVQIPAGTYIVGEDIPAGTYRFDMNKAMSVVEYYDNSSSLFPSTDFTLSTRSTVYAMLKLEDGGMLKIKNSSIILSYAKSLFTE